MSPDRIRALLTRLLLSLAIVTCVLGLSESARAQSTAPVPTAAVAAGDGQGQPGQQDAVVPALAPVQVAPTAPDGHAGHGEGAGVHAIGCMVAVGVAAIAFLLVLRFFELSRGAEPGPRLRVRARSGLQPRPPSLTTLCVQRV